MVEVCSVHVRKSISHICIYIYCKRYTFRSFLVLNSTHIISEVPNLTNTFVLMLIIIILSFINSGDMIEVCSVHVRKSISHNYAYTCIYSKLYTVHSFFSLNSTHIFSQAPNCNSTFYSMQTIIILSFINW